MPDLPAQRDPALIRLVTWNILKGGLGRLDPIYETLDYLRPDLVGLCETSEHSASYLAGKLGMDYALAEARDEEHHVALLSRWPIQRMLNVGAAASVQRGALDATVHRHGQPLRAAVVHLSPGVGPHAERQRLDELDRILPFIDPAAAIPAAILGDFNADAPYHPTDPGAMSPWRRARLALAGDTLAHDVVDRMTGAGWTDAYRRAVTGPPRHTLTTGHPAQRVDYIWLDAALAPRVIAADVETGGFAPYASDHFPLWADLRMSA